MVATTSFSVPGIAQPKGSSRAFMPPGAKYPVVTSDNPKLKKWAKLVSMYARQAWSGEPSDDPMCVVLQFGFVRPASVKASKRPDMTVRPDLDKLARGVIDALTGIVWTDDAQVVFLECTKKYVATGADGVHVTVASEGPNRA